MSNRAGIVMLVLSLLAIVALLLSEPDKTPSVTSCAQQWTDNRTNVEEFVTRDIYISRCEATLDDVRDGSLDGR